MSFVDDPTPLAVGVGVQLVPPQAAVLVSAVVLANSSPYQLTVNIAGNEWNLPAYTADMFPTAPTGVRVIITPTNPDGVPAALTGYVTPTWYASDEQPDPSSFPAPITASPWALAIALLASGIPSVLLDAPIAVAQPIVHGASATFDIAGYASIYVSCTGNRLHLQQYDDPGSIVDEYDYSSSPGHSVRLAVEAGTLKVTNTISAGSSDVTIWGSNRAAGRRFDARFQDTTGDQWQTIGHLFVVGAGAALTQLNALTILQGAAHATFHITGALVTGFFYLSSSTLATIAVCDTAEMFTGADGDRYATMKPISLPAGAYTFGFFCAGTGGNATAAVSIFQDAT